MGWLQRLVDDGDVVGQTQAWLAALMLESEARAVGAVLRRFLLPCAAPAAEVTRCLKTGYACWTGSAFRSDLLSSPRPQSSEGT